MVSAMVMGQGFGIINIRISIFSRRRHVCKFLVFLQWLSCGFRVALVWLTCGSRVVHVRLACCSRVEAVLWPKTFPDANCLATLGLNQAPHGRFSVLHLGVQRPASVATKQVSVILYLMLAYIETLYTPFIQRHVSRRCDKQS